MVLIRSHASKELIHNFTNSPKAGHFEMSWLRVADVSAH
jgi:hypothetical protein